MTTPVVVTVLPTIGLVSVVPWMSAMLVWLAGVSGAVGVAEPLGVGLAVGVIAAALCFRWELRQLRSRSAAGE